MCIRDSSYTYYDDSVLKSWVDDYFALDKVFCSSQEMVNQHSLYIHHLDGFANKVAKQGAEALSRRFEAILVGLRTMGGLLVDKNKETAEFISRSFGGVDKILIEQVDWFVAKTGLPKSIVMGSNQGSMSDGGDNDRKALNALVSEYQAEKLCPGYYKILKYLVSSGELDGKVLGFRLPASYPMDEKQVAEIEKIKAETEKITAETENLRANKENNTESNSSE